MDQQELTSRGNFGVAALSFISVAGFFGVTFSGVGGELTAGDSFSEVTQGLISNSTVWIVMLILSSHVTRLALAEGAKLRHRKLVGLSSALVLVASFVASMFGVLAFLAEFTSWGGVVGSFGQFILFAALAALALWAMISSLENTLKVFDVSINISLNKISRMEETGSETKTKITVAGDTIKKSTHEEIATEKEAGKDSERENVDPDEGSTT